MASLDELLAAMQNGVAAVNNLGNKLTTTFLQEGTVVSSGITTANSTITFTSSQAAGFVSVTTSSGAAYYFPVFR